MSPGDPAPDAVPTPRSWAVPLGTVAYALVVVGVLLTGLPDGSAGAVAVGGLVLAGACWIVAVRRPALPRPWVALALVLLGGAGAAVMAAQPAGPAFVLTYLAVAGLALLLELRRAVLLGIPLLLATALAEGVGSANLVSHLTTMLLGGTFAIVVAAFAAANRRAHVRIAELLEQQEALRAERERAAALAERTRLARELHDVLAHTLSGLTIQLEGARLLAETTGSDPRLAAAVDRAQTLARSGMAGARRAVATLRGEALPGPDELETLLADARAGGIAATLQVSGRPWSMSPEAGLALYRTVQESLTNVAKHAGPDAGARVQLHYGADEVEVTVSDSGGSGSTLATAGGGYGLAGVAERAALLGGRLDAAPLADGWQVRLRLPRSGS